MYQRIMITLTKQKDCNTYRRNMATGYGVEWHPRHITEVKQKQVLEGNPCPVLEASANWWLKFESEPHCKWHMCDVRCVQLPFLPEKTKLVQGLHLHSWVLQPVTKSRQWPQCRCLPRSADPFLSVLSHTFQPTCLINAIHPSNRCRVAIKHLWSIVQYDSVGKPRKSHASDMAIFLSCGYNLLRQLFGQGEAQAHEKRSCLPVSQII